MSVEGQIAAELDAEIIAHHKARKVERAIKQEYDTAGEAAGEHEVRAQRLRLALFKINGEEGSYGDANSANHHRLMELLRDAPADVDGREQ